MGLISNDRKHLLRTETSQKSLLKNFCYNSKVTRKAKDIKKLFDSEIQLSLQSYSAKNSKSFEFISWPSFLKGHHILSPGIWDKTFSDWFKKCSDGVWYKRIIFLFP